MPRYRFPYVLLFGRFLQRFRCRLICLPTISSFVRSTVCVDSHDVTHAVPTHYTTFDLPTVLAYYCYTMTTHRLHYTRSTPTPTLHSPTYHCHTPPYCLPLISLRPFPHVRYIRSRGTLRCSRCSPRLILITPHVLVVVTSLVIFALPYDFDLFLLIYLAHGRFCVTALILPLNFVTVASFALFVLIVRYSRFVVDCDCCIYVVPVTFDSVPDSSHIPHFPFVTSCCCCYIWCCYSTIAYIGCVDLLVLLFVVLPLLFLVDYIVLTYLLMIPYVIGVLQRYDRFDTRFCSTSCDCW